MSRSGYSEDYGGEFNNQLEFYRRAVDSALAGKRGPSVSERTSWLLSTRCPEKRLVPYAFETEEGEVCALVASSLGQVKGIEMPRGRFQQR